MECLCLKLEFGHLLPEIRRQDKGQRCKRGREGQGNEGIIKREKKDVEQQELMGEKEVEQKRVGEEGKKRETEMDKGAKILIVAGGKLISSTGFHFCVEKSRHIDRTTSHYKSKMLEKKRLLKMVQQQKHFKDSKLWS